jgi:cytochrome c553
LSSKKIKTFYALLSLLISIYILLLKFARLNKGFTMISKFNPLKSKRWAAAALSATILSVGAFGFSSAAEAQNLKLGKSTWQEGGADCVRCHGWAGDGQGEDERAPQGANLRVSFLDRETMEMFIKCGIPGTEMPHFDRGAYTDDRCFGQTAQQIGNDKPFIAERTIIKRQIDALLDYLFAEVVGKGMPVTLEVCEKYYKEGSTRCVGRYAPALAD